MYEQDLTTLTTSRKVKARTVIADKLIEIHVQVNEKLECRQQKCPVDHRGFTSVFSSLNVDLSAALLLLMLPDLFQINSVQPWYNRPAGSSQPVQGVLGHAGEHNQG